MVEAEIVYRQVTGQIAGITSTLARVAPDDPLYRSYRKFLAPILDEEKAKLPAAEAARGEAWKRLGFTPPQVEF
jgi:hypothetical protein